MSQSGQAGSAGGGGVSSLVVDGDVGSASPSANILNMLATPTSGATVQFNASGNTVSFNVSAFPTEGSSLISDSASATACCR